MRNDGAEVLLDQLGMFCTASPNEQKTIPYLRELLLHRGADRDAVENRVDRHSGELLLLGQRDPELVVGPQKLGIDLIEALERLDALRGRVVDDVLVVDGLVVDVAPSGAPSS